MKTQHLMSAALLALPFAVLAETEFKFASVCSDDMVLQRDVEAPVWGFADTGAVVRVSLFKEGDS